MTKDSEFDLVIERAVRAADEPDHTPQQQIGESEEHVLDLP
jgi:hypothetical protein